MNPDLYTRKKTYVSKQDYITELISNAEIDNGIIDQTLYDFLVESVQAYFDLKKSQAKREVTQVLRALFMVGA